MRFEYLQDCQCGGQYCFSTSGDHPFDEGVCSSCGASAHLLDPLTVSVVAERILHRSKSELDAGDYTLTILLAAIAVETFLTRIFLKIRGVEHFGLSFVLPNATDEASFKKEYPRNGGFERPANFVSKHLIGMNFDAFVSSNEEANKIYLRLQNESCLPLSKLAQSELFGPRNKIAHWGYVSAEVDDANRSYEIALALVRVLREMDKKRYAAPA